MCLIKQNPIVVASIILYFTIINQNKPLKRTINIFALSLLLVLPMLIVGCTQETQNKLGRTFQNWTGTNGVLDIYAGEKLVMRFIHIDKISTAYGTEDGQPRPYRYGYGYADLNFNYGRDSDEKKVYFEFSDYSTPYIFYESPK
jgi:hypothetical protein